MQNKIYHCIFWPGRGLFFSFRSLKVLPKHSLFLTTFGFEMCQKLGILFHTKISLTLQPFKCMDHFTKITKILLKNRLSVVLSCGGPSSRRPPPCDVCRLSSIVNTCPEYWRSAVSRNPCSFRWWVVMLRFLLSSYMSSVRVVRVGDERK